VGAADGYPMRLLQPRDPHGAPRAGPPYRSVARFAESLRSWKRRSAPRWRRHHPGSDKTPPQSRPPTGADSFSVTNLPSIRSCLSLCFT